MIMSSIIPESVLRPLYDVGIVSKPKKESTTLSSWREKISRSYESLEESDPHRFRVWVIFLTVYIVILMALPRSYYWWYPTIPVYPNNEEEIEIIMKDYIGKRMPSDIEHFQMTDINPARGFETVIRPEEMSLREMTKIIHRPITVFIIFFTKFLFNRARPFMVAPHIINRENGTLLESKTAVLPSYPSGHAFQGFYLAKILCRRFPSKTQAIMEAAERVANARILAGLHYPSDREFARKLVAMF